MESDKSFIMWMNYLCLRHGECLQLEMFTWGMFTIGNVVVNKRASSFLIDSWGEKEIKCKPKTHKIPYKCSRFYEGKRNRSDTTESNCFLRRCFVLDNQRSPLGSGVILTEI